jgi:hypothetical protein
MISGCTGADGDISNEVKVPSYTRYNMSVILGVVTCL